MRDLLFVSHANPEDNGVALWLTLQLAKEGYPVWCDLTRLLGGEDFWGDIERAIRERAAKFVFVLSKISNRKQGPLQELHIAHAVMRSNHLSDFILPLLIDDLPIGEVNIQLARLNIIPFSRGWAKGLHDLMEKLNDHGVPKSQRFTPSAVTSWWRNQFSADRGVLEQQEELLSNWFPIRALPDTLYLHTLHRSQVGKVEVKGPLPFPGFQHNQYLVSFAQAGDFDDKLGALLSISDSRSVSTAHFLEGKVDRRLPDRKKARDIVSSLLRMGWEQTAAGRGLSRYELANQAQCFFFRKGLLENDRVRFVGVDGLHTFRALVGYRTVMSAVNRVSSRRYWHYGIRAKPLVYPTLAFAITAHVLFSDNGSSIWESKLRLHRARRTQCKDWWNPEWRDRMLAAMRWLAGDDVRIRVPLGSAAGVDVECVPLTFSSPVTYTDPVGDMAVEEQEEYEVDEPGDLDDE